MRALHGAGGGLDSVGGVSVSNSHDGDDDDGIAGGGYGGSGSSTQPVASFNAYELEAMDLDLSAGTCGQRDARATIETLHPKPPLESNLQPQVNRIRGINFEGQGEIEQFPQFGFSLFL